MPSTSLFNFANNVFFHTEFIGEFFGIEVSYEKTNIYSELGSMVFSLIVIFIGSKALTNYVNPESKNVMDLRIPLYTLFVMEAAYLLLIKFKDDNKKTIWLIVNAVPAILSAVCAFKVCSAREPAIYGFLALTIITVIIATIRCIKSCDDEIENSCLEFLGW